MASERSDRASDGGDDPLASLRLGELAELLPDGLVVADAHGRVIEANARAGHIVGVAAATLLGRDIREALPLQDVDGRSFWACSDPWHGLATRTGHRERLLLLADGDEVLVSAKYIRPGRLEPVSAVVLSLRDAHARKRVEANNSVLVATVAHELRSPLTSVKGFSSTLRRRWDQLEDQQKLWMIEAIESDADRVARLITELLDVSRIDSGRLQVRSQPVDLPAKIHAHVDSLLTAGSYGPERFVVDIAPGLPEVWADPDRIDQILANLLENALRHGDGTVQLAVAAGDDDRRVAVTISDDGPGVDEEHHHVIFTRFWHSRPQGGTGLGLYIVRGLVEAHGGEITVGRAPSGGAQFRFTLPAGAPERFA